MDETQTSAYLVVTVAHHGDDEFYELARVMPAAGGAMLDWDARPVPDVTHEVPPLALFAAIAEDACPRDDHGASTHTEWCIVLDCYGDGHSITEDKEISRADADRLLDGQFDQRLDAARASLAAFYARGA